MQKVNENIRKIIDFSKKNNPRGYFLDKIFSWNSKSVKPGQVFISIKTKKSKKYDYILTEIEISGLNNVSEIEINQHFKKYNNKSIFLVPIIEISKKIENNSWIESIILKNNFKNKISIFIKEFKPIGIYFNGESYLLINKLGYVIDFANNNEILKYIIFEGQESITKAPNLIIAIPLYFILECIFGSAQCYS